MIKELVAQMNGLLKIDIKEMFPDIKDYSIEFVLLQQIKKLCEEL